MLDRLGRIQELEASGAAAPTLLAELRALLHEAEAYAEEEGGDRCSVAVERLRLALARDMIEV